MSLVDAVRIAQIAEHCATVIALLVGGGWVLFQYVIRRSGETGLSIGIVSTVTPWSGNRHLLFTDVVLKNTGHRRLEASVRPQSWFQKEFERSIRYAGSLQLRRIEGPPVGKVAHLDWWKAPALFDESVVPEVNLLIEYTDENERVEFFMEPGEEYHLGNAFVLSSGSYLAKVVFVGRKEHEYWGRIAHIRVE